MKSIYTVIGGLLLGGLAVNAQAIPLSYGQVTHDTSAWQELANVAKGDEYGVSWTIDGGLTWGRDELFVGQTVQFKFNVHKDNVGTHYADLTKAWVDWGQDGSFDAADNIFYAEHLLSSEPVLGSWLTPTIPDLEYLSAGYLLTQADVGETWLRALATCTHSVTNMYGGSWSDQWDPAYVNHYEDLLVPTGHYYQGETEEWKLVVHAVSEPSATLLLGLGMFGLLIAHRRAGQTSH
ncbi:MAG: hypothetical protein P8Y45_12075 [Exilibacterium sp.]